MNGTLLSIVIPVFNEEAGINELYQRLARAFVTRLARKMGRRPVELSEEDVHRLCAYDWPGNVRELENVLERALITSPPDRIVLDRALSRGAASRPPDPAPDGEDGPVLDREAMKEFEKKNILRALFRCGGQVAGEEGAARLLGLSPSTLTSRMKSLGIRRP